MPVAMTLPPKIPTQPTLPTATCTSRLVIIVIAPSRMIPPNISAKIKLGVRAAPWIAERTTTAYVMFSRKCITVKPGMPPSATNVCQGCPDTASTSATQSQVAEAMISPRRIPSRSALWPRGGCTDGMYDAFMILDSSSRPASPSAELQDAAVQRRAEMMRAYHPPRRAYQHRQLRNRFSRSLAAGRLGRARCAGDPREPEREGGSDTELTANGDLAAERVREKTADRQSEAGTGLVTVADPAELLENEFQLVWRNAVSRVRNFDDHPVTVVAGGADRPVCRRHRYQSTVGVLDGIGQQVGDDLTHSRPARSNERQSVIAVHGERQPARPSVRLVLLAHVVQQRRHIQQLRGEREMSSFGARQLVEIVDQPHRLVDAPPQARDAFFLSRVQVSVHAAAEQFRIPVGRADRILHIVAESTHQTRSTAHHSLQSPAPLDCLVQQPHLLVRECREMAEDRGTTNVVRGERLARAQHE